MSTFAKAIDEWIKSEENSPMNHAILCYLKRHAMGSGNAKSWNKIAEALGIAPHYKNTFQNKLLKRSRESNLYIGSNDQPGSMGYFLIASEADAQIMASFYEKRIASEQVHLDHLRKLCQKAF